MKIRIVLANHTLHVTLDASASSREFAALLPLALTLDDYAATEKIAMLPRKLSAVGASAGTTPAEGDFAYYAPWGNIAIFLKPFRHSPGLVRLGRIEGGLDWLRAPGPIAVRFEAEA